MIASTTHLSSSHVNAIDVTRYTSETFPPSSRQPHLHSGNNELQLKFQVVAT